MRLFFAINQNPLDGSAHALYCVRNAWWLARTMPNERVELLYPSSRQDDLLPQFGLSPLPNLALVPLRALRREKGKRGLNVNAVFHWSVRRYLAREMRQKDLFLTASFPKLFRSVAADRNLRKRGGAFVYEVHQYSKLEGDEKAAAIEREIYGTADLLITTTTALRELLLLDFPQQRIAVNGLACGFDPNVAPPARSWSPNSPFTLAYLGSLYEEQGVDWLIGSLPALQNLAGVNVRLKIGGGGEAHLERLKVAAKQSGVEQAVQFSGRVGLSDLTAFMADVDALVIPSLNRGRMPYVAITKAYDYLALRRPLLVSRLPSITDVLREDQEALVFNPGDTNSFAKAAARLVQDPSLRQALAARGLERAAQFSWEERSRRHWTLLTETINRGGQ
ncbi:MAG TPA: glycosyltransferase [Methylomirabilota bacterium]|nr:glycosyltransferase [Methylomirabilota bacterium]